MKWIIPILLIAAMSSYADEPATNASDFTTISAQDFNVGPKTYGVVAATPNLLILEVRRYSDNQLLHDVVLRSPYMLPEYDFEDLLLDGTGEVVVRTKTGGTGVHETHLTIFGFVADRVVQFGDFVLDRQVDLPNYKERLTAEVSFPRKNYLSYRYNQEITENKKTVKNERTETYLFSIVTLKYERTTEPEQGVPPDRRERAPASR